MIVIETERMIFRSHEEADLEAFCALEGDPEVRRWIGGAPRTRAAAEQRFRARFLPAPLDRLALWAAVLKHDRCWIGYCGVYPHFLDTGQAVIPDEGMLGFAFARERWGRGLATEAARAFVNFGFRELRSSRIVAIVQQGNAASLRVLEKAGFREYRFEAGDPRAFHHLECRAPVAMGPQ